MTLGRRLLRISLVDFLNARPLTWGLLHDPPEGIFISRDAPSVCADKLASGEVDVGLIPSIEYQRIPGLSVIRSLGIAASSEVRSVLLVSEVSRDKIGSVSLDPASRTSAALVRILLKRVYGLDPAYLDSGITDARLIIGDPALKTRLNGRVVLDLAAEWRAFSGHPFVFAFWAARESAATPETAALLARSYEAGCSQFEVLVREESQQTGLSAPVIEDYLRHALHYELDKGDLEGLDLFYRMAAEDGLVEKALPLRFIG
jgi:chorismate dehydratase